MYNVTGFSKLRALFTALVSGLICVLLYLICGWSGLFDLMNSVQSMAVTGIFILLASLSTLFILQTALLKHVKIITNILDKLSDIVIMKDYNGNFIFCNKELARLYGTTPEKMIGKDDFYFTKNREQADFFLENVRQIMDSNQSEEVYESSTDANTGQVRHFQSVKIPFIDYENNKKILVVAKDITDIVQLKEEADRAKKRLGHVLDVSQEGLWEWNMSTNEVLHNPRWEEITGINSSENTFAEFEEAILPIDRPKVMGALQALVENNAPYNIEFRLKRPDGEIIWIWDRGRAAEFNEEGKPTLLVGIAHDITEVKLNQARIENLAYHDQLTGLYNRTQLERVLAQTIEESAENNQYSALLFLDLDRFKLLNDSYGHHMGDRLLKLVATRISRISKHQAIISRFGGDEFVIIYPLISDEQQQALEFTQQFAETLIAEISKPMLIKSDIQELVIEYDVAVSVGGIIFNQRPENQDLLLQLADSALYRVKAAGGQHSIIFDATMENDLAHSSQLLKDMRESIHNQNFVIYLQPQYSSAGSLIGAEALVRWQHPELGLLTPDKFIDRAEESNLIINIGQLVLEQACATLKQWQSRPQTKELSISVNLSAKQIWQSHFVEEFIATVEGYGIDKNKLVVEVTESLLILDIDDATQKLSKLKAYGFIISLDDFGIGYSSLNYLRHLPIDEIKIDRSFMNDSEVDSQAQLMIKSIIDLARNFNLQVVAEGVENMDQVELLRQLQVDYFQGYYFGKPVDIEQFHQQFLS